MCRRYTLTCVHPAVGSESIWQDSRDSAGMLVQVKESSWIASIAARNLHAAKLAMVFGKKIYLFNTTRSEFLKNRRWVCHELVHVEQFARYGMAGFLIRYLWETIRKGYHHNRFEVEARQRENDERILQGITIR